MFDNEIMMQGERLKKIRQIILGATQEEISAGVCTRIMISLIENNKQKLSYNIAYGIAENLNKIAREKKINLSLITAKELMIDENEQANYIFQDNILRQLLKPEINAMEIDWFEKIIAEADNLIAQYNITDDKKIEFYKLSADFYYYKHSYIKSEQMCDLGLKISINSKNSFHEITFYIYKSKNNIFTENYIRALQQLNYAENLNSYVNSEELYQMIYYHKALTYKKLGKYEDAIKNFEILKEKFEIKNKKMLLKVKMVYANCLNDYHKFDEAEKEYKETLDMAMKYKCKDFICITYRNLAELYFNKKNYKSSAIYIKESLLYSDNTVYSNEILYFAAKVFKYLNEDVEEYLLQSLDICERNDRENIDLIKDILYELLLIYLKRDDEDNIALMVKKSNELKTDCYLIYAELIKYYRYLDEDKSNYYNDKLIDKLKETTIL